jgi:hypothetical protein
MSSISSFSSSISVYSTSLTEWNTFDGREMTSLAWSAFKRHSGHRRGTHPTRRWRYTRSNKGMSFWSNSNPQICSCMVSMILWRILISSLELTGLLRCIQFYHLLCGLIVDLDNGPISWRVPMRESYHVIFLSFFHPIIYDHSILIFNVKL